MSEHVFKHRGQIGSMEIDPEDCCLHGKLLHINDLVTYESESVQGLRKEFEAAVDDYLETCAELGQEPNKPFKGSFNVRCGEDLHRALTLRATSEGLGLNEACIKAFKLYVGDEKSPFVAHVHNHNHTHMHYQTGGRFDFDKAMDQPGKWEFSERRPNLKAVGESSCRH